MERTLFQQAISVFNELKQDEYGKVLLEILANNTSIFLEVVKTFQLSDIDREALDIYHSGNGSKIPAIKYIRQVKNLSLKEAVDYLDKISF